MTIRHLRIFLSVYQEMNITHAAELLHMTQPAVTRSIRELENYYSVRLFERINHRLYRTKSGEELYARAQHIIQSFDELESILKHQKEVGVLRIGSSITLGSFFLPAVVKEFQKKYPHLQIRVTVSNTGLIQQGILDNTIDVAIIEDHCSSDYIHEELLTEDSMKLIVPPDHPLLAQKNVYFKDLLPYPLLLRENGSAARVFLDHIFAFHGYEIEPVWESASTQALVNAVSTGLGISILPKQLVLSDLHSKVISSVSLKDESFLRKNYIIWHQQKFLTDPVKEFITFCHASAEKNKAKKSYPPT